MKKIQNILVIPLLILLIIIQGSTVYAMNTGFSTENLSIEKCNSIISNINLSLLAEEPNIKTIDCFDVNKNGNIALGSSLLGKKIICVYSNQNEFQYGYTFNCTGSFGIEWDENSLNVYLVRSDIAINVNSNAEINEVFTILNTSDNNSYWNKSVFSTKRKINDIEYVLKNNMSILNVFATSYSQLISVNNTGEETIIFTVNSSKYIDTMIKFIGVIIFVFLSLFFVIKNYNKINQKP